MTSAIAKRIRMMPLAALSIMIGTVGPVATEPAFAQAVSLSPVEAYVLGPGDIVEIAVAGDAQSANRVQIQADGTIQLALIGSVQAAGNTVLSLRDKISGALKSGGFFTNPAVNITIVNYASRYVVVLGEVGQPGTVPLDRAYRVSDILSRVGGVKSGGAKVLKLRRATGEELTLGINQIATGGSDEDPLVQPGDKLFVPSAQTFYISGQVNRPGTYPLDADLTLRKALAVAGGLTQLGSAKKAKVIRDGKELPNFSLDAPLELGDVVEVGERFF